jgi:hypothetical protein
VPDDTARTALPVIELPFKVPTFAAAPLKLVVPAPLKLANVAVARNSIVASFWTAAKVPEFATNNVPAATAVGVV